MLGDMLPTAPLPALTLLVLLLPLPLLLLEVMPLLDAMSLTLPELSTSPRGLLTLRLIPTMPPMAMVLVPMVWAMLELVWVMLELTELTPTVSAMLPAMLPTAPLLLSTLLASPPLPPLLLVEDMPLLAATVPTAPVSSTVLRQHYAIGIL